MPSNDRLGTTFADQAYEMAGQLINARHKRLNAMGGATAGGHTSGKHYGHVGATSRHSPTILDAAQISDASANELQRRYYDSTDIRWRQSDESELWVTGAYERQPAYATGDVVAAYWDELRNTRVPLQDVKQDIPQVEFWTNGQAVDQVYHEDAGERDAYATVMLQVRYPSGSDWVTFSTLNWPTPNCEATRDYRDTRSNFALFGAPSGTLIRFVAIASSATEILLDRMQARFYGAGRNSPAANFGPHEAPESPIGSVVKQWKVRAETEGAFKDDPSFAVSNRHGVFEVSYEDPLDDWILGCDFWALLANSTRSSVQPVSIQVVTDFTCSGGFDWNKGPIGPGELILFAPTASYAWCYRTLTFPAEIANCITIGEEECFSCEDASQETTSQSSLSSVSSVSSESSTSLSSQSSSSTRTECCSSGECIWIWDGDDWNLFDTCTGLNCLPEICECTNPPVGDGTFIGQEHVGQCVPA